MRKSWSPVGIFLLCTTSFVFLSGCAGKKKTMFESLSASETGIKFVNKLPERERLNILYYLYYYDGGGVATGDINHDGLPDIYFTANTPGNNKLYLNKGNFQFEDITSKAKVAGSSDWSSGVTMADVNGDGWLDIYVCAISEKSDLKGRNELFINNHNGSFTERAQEYGLAFSCYSNQAAFFDYDNDGDLDCYILNQSDRPFLNIVDTSNRRKYDRHSGDILLRNDLNTPAKKFTDVSASAGISQSNLGYGLGLAVADINNDGFMDIYVGNDFHENDYYYVNNGNGSFTESGARHFRHYSRFSMGNDIADYNNDGQLDIVTVDMLPPDEKVLKTYGSDENPDIYKFKVIRNGFQPQYSKNSLQRNNGNGSSFSETSLISGIAATDWSWCPLFADFDNDGNKDLFITSGIVKRTTDLDYIRFVSDLQMKKGSSQTDQYDQLAIDKMPDGSSHPYLYKGDGKLNFTDVSEAWGTGRLTGYSNGAAYADLDNDGNLDLVVNCINASAMVLKNTAPKKSYISISFNGNDLNTSGIGARAYVYANGRMQYQQLSTTRGFQSSSEPRLHFGLDSAIVIDSVVIVWPDQQFQVLTKVAVNKSLVAQQEEASGRFDSAGRMPISAPVLKQIDQTNKAWRHKENPFEDFDAQYLIPHGESTRGPKLAVADVNGDGLDDLFAGGAKGQPGALLLQQRDGSFLPIDTTIFRKDANSEDVDAIFLDANGDKSPDLFVVSGGNQAFGQDSSLLDRLYLNDGKGHFQKTTTALPAIFQNKSCVTTADVDRDGDLDLFVGGLADPRSFGTPQTSYLLINDGKGIFSLADEKTISLSALGIVTTGVFTDMNKDGWPDLLVAGEWMPLTIFLNNKGQFDKHAIPNSTGLWQTLLAEDVNGDGNMDLLAGNWGWNNKLWAGKDGPAKLYVGDFDKNGRTEQLLSYTAGGVEYPFLAKDEVERALPLLKKHYLLYAEYAGVPMKDVFYGWIDNVKPFTAERLGSVIGYGDGKGGLKLQDLPADLQLAPVFSFCTLDPAKKNAFLAGGNFYDVIPYEGRYDAQALGIFVTGPGNNSRYLAQSNLADIQGEVRDIKWLRSSGGPLLIVARNNEPLLFFRNAN